MAYPLSFRWDDEFVARIDERRGLVSRSAWVRAAVEYALLEIEARGLFSSQWEGMAATPAPVEQPRVVRQPGPDVSRVRSSQQRVHAATCKCAMCVPPKRP